MGQLNSAPIAIPDSVAGCQATNPSSGRTGNLQYINPACFTNAQAPSPAFFSAHCDPMPPIGPKGAPATPQSQGLSPLTCFNLLGNLGRNTVIGPGLVNVDFSVVKSIKVPKISETFNIQFRTEFFNVFNHANFAPPIDNLQSLDGNGQPIAGFGQLTALQVPTREIQFALKVVW